MTDRAEPGVTPLTEADPTGLYAALRPFLQPDGSGYVIPFAAVATIGLALDAATPRPGLVERIADALETIGVVWANYPGGQYEGSQRDRAERTIAAALASGTGELGLDERERCGVHTFIALEDCEVHGPLANDKGADPTPEPK